MKKLPGIFSIPLILLIIISISALGISGCGKKIPEVVGCSISSVLPTTGCPGNVVTISGTTFGAATGSVSFDNLTATVIYWSDTFLVVSAPGGDYSNVTVTPTVSDPCSLAGTYSYDNVPPAAPMITFPADGSCVNTSTVVIDVSCGEGSCEQRCDSDSWGACDGVIVFPDSSHICEFRCVDTCGNVSGIAGVTFVVDTIPPTPPTISSPTTGQCFITTTNIPTSISCDEGTCEERIDSGAWQPCNTGFTTSPGEESHTVDARCIDACENMSCVRSVTFLKDTVLAFCGFGICIDCPEKGAFSVGEEFIFGVNVCLPDRNLGGYDMRISYDPGVVNLIKATGGDADEFSRVVINIQNTPNPDSGLATSLFNGVNNGVTLFNSPSGPKINVAKLTFKAVGKGRSGLFLQSVGLWDTAIKPVSPGASEDEWVKVE